MSINAHPALPAFDYIKPKTLVEASQFLAEHAGESRPLLGGTDTIVRMRDGIWKDKYLVDVKGLEGTKELSFDPNTGLTVGAAVNMNKVSSFPAVLKHYPLLAEACDTVASYQLRSRATIVGNICNASPAGDTLGASMLLGGVLHVHGVKGTKDISLTDFFKGPGRTVLEPGDIVTSIHFPLPPKGAVGKYIKHGRNNKSDLSIVGVTVLMIPEGKGRTTKVALASVAPVPLYVKSIESYFIENPLDEEHISKAADMVMEACAPIDDVRSSARYRKMMVRNLTKRALLAISNN